MEPNKEQPLELQLEISDTNFSVQDKISVALILKNQSGTPVTVNKRMSINPEDMPDKLWEVRFDIVFPPGEREIRGSLINRGRPGQDDFMTIQPGGEVRQSYTLTDWYWMRLPGTYEITAVYHNVVDGSQFGLSAWTGEITSNSVSLTVSK